MIQGTNLNKFTFWGLAPQTQATTKPATVGTTTPSSTNSITQYQALTRPVPVTQHNQIPAGLLGAPNAKEAEKVYIKAYVPTPPIAGELRQAGVANIFTPAWREQIEAARKLNGGMGNATDGYLAFSKNGFMRLKNDHLTDEQNRKLAEFTLLTGTPVENTPARALNEMDRKATMQEWASEFLGKHEAAMTGFMTDPAAGYKIKDGRNLYTMQLDQASGYVVSQHQKLHGGFRGFIQKHLPTISKVLGGISTIASFIPGAGTLVAAGAKALQVGATAIATGKAKLGDLLSTAASFIPGGGIIKNLAREGISLLGSVIDNGKVALGDLISSGLNLLADTKFGKAIGGTLGKGLDFVKDLAGKVWNLPNTVIGTLWGMLGVPFGANVTFDNNAIQFENHPFMFDEGAITLGNTTIYDTNAWPSKTIEAQPGVTYAQHEIQHTFQGELFGPLYLPANILGGLLANLNQGFWHGDSNFMETGPKSSSPKPF
ncbi:hypothetical protein JNK13_01220 [bacterium]|nr:hypothetical protein [bacterium]